MENSTISGGARKPWAGDTRDPVWTRRFGKRALLNCCLVRWTVALLNPKKAGKWHAAEARHCLAHRHGAEPRGDASRSRGTRRTRIESLLSRAGGGSDDDLTLSGHQLLCKRPPATTLPPTTAAVYRNADFSSATPPYPPNSLPALTDRPQMPCGQHCSLARSLLLHIWERGWRGSCISSRSQGRGDCGSQQRHHRQHQHRAHSGGPKRQGCKSLRAAY
ncbi:unnamed protein product [Lampetra fluviatilis]